MHQISTGLGTSEHPDPATAGTAAAAEALAGLGTEDPALIMVYSSVRYDLQPLLDAIRRITGDTPMVGASTSGHFSGGHLTEPGRGVAVLALSAGPYRFATSFATGLRSDPAEAGATLVRQARSALGQPDTTHAALIVLCCGLTGGHQELVNGIYRAAGAALPVVGGIASDDRRMRETYVFHDGRVLTDGAVAALVTADHPMTVVRGHGWKALGLPMPITGVDGTAVRTIAGRPAAEVFMETVASSGLCGDQEQDSSPADGGEHVLLGEAGRCLGLIEPDGSRTIRGAFMGENGEINTWVPLPPYAAVQVMSCTRDDLLRVCDSIPEQTFAGLKPSGTAPGVLLAFSCVARMRFLGDRSAEEAARLQRAAGAVPTFGFYTYGEFARTTSIEGVHNATVTALAL